MTVRFRGRELTHPELGRNMLARFTDRIKEHGTPERAPLLEGKSMHLTVASVHKPKEHEAPVRPPREVSETLPADAQPVAEASKPSPAAPAGAAEATDANEAGEAPAAAKPAPPTESKPAAEAKPASEAGSRPPKPSRPGRAQAGRRAQAGGPSRESHRQPGPAAAGAAATAPAPAARATKERQRRRPIAPAATGE